MKNPADILATWYKANGRMLPWRETKDPYLIWLSEIIFQQTRIEQGTEYYLRFTRRFPDVFSLAAAPEDEVMKLWEGLGYYSRARNLHFTAKHVANELNGLFPGHFSELEKLKGIGPYTARAIGSISFGNPVGVLDGNVFRVLSRYLADFSPVDSNSTKKRFQEILDSWVRSKNAGDFNQAMMDLGAMVCTPRNPHCGECPLQAHCKAYKDNCMEQLPVKSKKTSRTDRYYWFFIGTDPQNIQIRKRPSVGLWANLYELPNLTVTKKEWEKVPSENEDLGQLKHVLTHMDLYIRVLGGKVPASATEGDFFPVGSIKAKEYAFSKAVLKIFERYLPEFY